MEQQRIYVSIDLEGQTYLVGTLWCYFRNGKETASFEYSKEWLEHPERFALEPMLQLHQGTFHTNQHQKLFGAIGDSAPDRWGRVLIQRSHVQNARSNQQAVTSLKEIDYLLAVSDIARGGALRFSKEVNGPYLAEPQDNIVPPLVFLPKLLAATERFLEHNSTQQDLQLLLAPGSSLGGARPKASILDKNNQLAIAKFPNNNDDYNVILWEAVALDLARKAGIATPVWQIEYIVNKPVLILQRFDRVGNLRIPFLSAMSMLGAKDNEQRSYLEIAYAIMQHGSQVQQDLTELWRRIVFNILINNNDDHLRNHAFLYQNQQGWKLSPAYDLNPTPIYIRPRILATAINFEDSTASLDLAYSVIDEFRISKKQADIIVKEVATAVTEWRNVALNFGITMSEINLMATAFESEDLQKVM